MDTGSAGRLWGGVYPGVRGLGGAPLGHDVRRGEGETKDWDQGARGEGLGAVYPEACVWGGSNLYGGPEVVLRGGRVGVRL